MGTRFPTFRTAKLSIFSFTRSFAATIAWRWVLVRLFQTFTKPNAQSTAHWDMSELAKAFKTSMKPNYDRIKESLKFFRLKTAENVANYTLLNQVY